MPIFKAVKIHRDYHAEVAKALYSLPECWIGQTLDVRADSELVKFYHRGVLVITIPASRPSRHTDPMICPSIRSATTLRDLDPDHRLRRPRAQRRDLRRTDPR